MKYVGGHKRKRIAVFLGEIGREYQKVFISKIKSIACSKGYDVFVFNNFGAYASTMLFDAGERDVIYIPDFSEFCGVISLPDTYDIDGMEEMLLNRIKSESDCPIVSVRNGSKDTYRITFDNYGTIYDMTNHFIKHHGYTNICYMSGPYSVEDSMNRFNGFKDAMIDAGLEVTDDILFEGDFWKFLTIPATEKFLKAYDGKTQAIICANDYMAIGLMEEFHKRGIRVPEDIAISGFDEVIEGQVGTPTLTSVAIPIEDMAHKAMEIIENVNSGRYVSPENPLTGNIHFKSSCGCSCDKPEIDVALYINRITDEYVNVRTATLFITDIQNRITEKEKLSFVNDYTKTFRFTKTFLCLCTDDYKDDNPYSETMAVHAIFPFTEETAESPILDIKFDRKHILPDSVYDNSEPGCYVVFPIHHKNTTFGYMVSEWNENDYTMFVAPYAEGIALTYNDLQLQEQYSEFVEIKKQSLMDPLTGISNRRGFEQELTALMSHKTLASKYISFVSADLDNLKPINDNYGHHEGDVAIKMVANVLKQVVGTDNICARVGGDEFYAVITSSDANVQNTLMEKFYAELDQSCANLNKDYKIHASIGIYTVDSSLLDKAFEHLQVADKRMYEAKRKYKNE